MGPVKVAVDVDAENVHGIPDFAQVSDHKGLAQCVGLSRVGNAVLQYLDRLTVAFPGLAQHVTESNRVKRPP